VTVPFAASFPRIPTAQGRILFAEFGAPRYAQFRMRTAEILRRPDCIGTPQDDRHRPSSSPQPLVPAPLLEQGIEHRHQVCCTPGAELREEGQSDL